jgi:hypothetical protein
MVESAPLISCVRFRSALPVISPEANQENRDGEWANRAVAMGKKAGMAQYARKRDTLPNGPLSAHAA